MSWTDKTDKKLKIAFIIIGILLFGGAIMKLAAQTTIKADSNAVFRIKKVVQENWETVDVASLDKEIIEQDSIISKAQRRKAEIKKERIGVEKEETKIKDNRKKKEEAERLRQEAILKKQEEERKKQEQGNKPQNAPANTSKINPKKN